MKILSTFWVSRTYRNSIFAIVLLFATLPTSPLSSDTKPSLSVISHLLINERTGTIQKQETPLNVSIITADTLADVQFVIEFIREVNRIASSDVFRIHEILVNINHDASRRVDPKSDVVIIKGTGILNKRIAAFRFNITDFVYNYLSIPFDEIYFELTNDRYACRQYEKRSQENEKDKFLVILDDWFDQQIYTECIAMLVLQMAGVFLSNDDRKHITAAASNKPQIENILNNDTTLALKLLYTDEIKRGNDISHIENAYTRVVKSMPTNK